MNDILTDLSQISSKLSEIFNVSVEFIENNLMEYVIKYGKYVMIKDVIALTGIYIFLIVPMLTFLAGLFTDYFNFYDENNKKRFWVVWTIILIMGLIFVISYNVIPYMMYQEIYGIDAAMKLSRGEN